MADTRRLLDGLVEYRESLERHLTSLVAEFGVLQSRWRMFSAVYDGDAAEEFRHRWERTVSHFREYEKQTAGLARMLDERIEHLRELNRRPGSSSW